MRRCAGGPRQPRELSGSDRGWVSSGYRILGQLLEDLELIARPTQSFSRLATLGSPGKLLSFTQASPHLKKIKKSAIQQVLTPASISQWQGHPLNVPTLLITQVLNCPVAFNRHCPLFAFWCQVLEACDLSPAQLRHHHLSSVTELYLLLFWMKDDCY